MILLIGFIIGLIAGIAGLVWYQHTGAK